MDLQDHDGGAHLHAYVRSHQRGIEGQLAERVRVPGVLGMPEHTQDLLRSANWLAAAFREAGFPVVEVQPTVESHAVYAEWCAAPGARTVLVYSHHDVRAAKPENREQTAPFEPVVREGRLYGRGSSDAKGQVLAHLWGVRAHLHQQATRSLTYDRQNPDALSPLDAESQTLSHPSSPAQDRSAEPAPAVNLKFLVEGEEEGGSANLATLLEEQAERLQADVVLFSDTLLWHADYPALCMSLRGMLSASLEVYGPERDVHSGAVSGNAPNPAFELGRLLALLHDEDGRIALPGFYDDVEPLPEDLRQALAELPFGEEDWLKRSESGAFGHTLTPDLETAQEPYRTPDHPAVGALERAMAVGFRSGKVGRMGNAGGGPAELLSRALDVPVLFFGAGLVEDHWHDSDESVSLEVLLNGAVTLACFWDELARMHQPKDDGDGPPRQ